LHFCNFVQIDQLQLSFFSYIRYNVRKIKQYPGTRKPPFSRSHCGLHSERNFSNANTDIYTSDPDCHRHLSGRVHHNRRKKHKKKRQANTPTDDAATDGIEKRHADGRENHMATGMCLGMCFGCAIGSSLIARFGPEALSCGISFGMLLGMTVGMNIKQKK